MLKKMTLTMSLLALTACGNQFFPPQPAYKISEQDMKEFLSEFNKFQVCARPELKGLSLQETKKVYSKQSKAETYVWTLYSQGILNSIIGENNTNILKSDPASSNYFENLAHQLYTPIKSIDKNFCNNMREQYAMFIASAKKEVKKQEARLMAEKRKREAEELAEKKKREAEEKARQEFYQTPQGQAYLAQQAMLMRHQQMLQAQQQAHEERLARMNFANSVSNLNQSIQDTNRNITNQYNQMNYQNSINQINQSLRGINNNLNRISSPSNQIRWNSVY